MATVIQENVRYLKGSMEGWRIASRYTIDNSKRGKFSISLEYAAPCMGFAEPNKDIPRCTIMYVGVEEEACEKITQVATVFFKDWAEVAPKHLCERGQRLFNTEGDPVDDGYQDSGEDYFYASSGQTSIKSHVTIREGETPVRLYINAQETLFDDVWTDMSNHFKPLHDAAKFF